jgi:hypothetical protein
MDAFQQQDKEVSRISEVTHTLNRYTVEYRFEGEPPVIEIETRQGQAEYIFMYCDFQRAPLYDPAMPTKQPVIGAIQYHVFGRENRFAGQLDRYDLERISRDNCHRLSDWRTLHDEGRGILIHLADLGLTEEVPFPRRGRMKLKFTLLTTIEPAVEYFGSYDTGLHMGSPHKRLWTVCLLRHNRLLKGDIRGMRFSFLNEEE